MTLAFDAILAAKDRLQGHIERTPCRHSRTLSEITGADVWVKFENLQFTAAYKERGALNKLLQLTGRPSKEARRHRRTLGRQTTVRGWPITPPLLGIPKRETIVMPRGTPS